LPLGERYQFIVILDYQIGRSDKLRNQKQEVTTPRKTQAFSIISLIEQFGHWAVWVSWKAVHR